MYLLLCVISVVLFIFFPLLGAIIIKEVDIQTGRVGPLTVQFVGKFLVIRTKFVRNIDFLVPEAILYSSMRLFKPLLSALRTKREQ
jgi:hypothetical protein